MSYQYDSLQRLISAVTTGPEWGQSFSYDGFGNLLAKSVTKGSAPALSVNVDGATNRITTAGFGYDANGNMTAIPGVTGVAYDGRNRLTAAGGDQYSYRPDNKRLWKKLPGGTEELYFYSIRGERLGTYEPAVDGTVLYLKFKSTEVYFAGSLIRSQGQAVVLDRLGSGRSFGGTAMRYFPYREEQTSTPNGRPKFGTYFRDESTGLDYANQRYYGSGMGRFLTPDPYQGSAGAADPGSWNRSTYVGSDPVNANDPTGLCIWCAELLMFPTDAGGGGVIWRSDIPWGDPYLQAAGWLQDPRYYGAGAILPSERGVHCQFAVQPGENPFCPVWRVYVYGQIAGGVAWGVAAVGGGGGGGKESEEQTPGCFASLKYRDVAWPEGADLLPFNHAFWWVRDGAGIRYIISGGPAEWPATASDFDTRPPATYLRVWVVPGDRNGQDHSGQATHWSSGSSILHCAKVSFMIYLANNFPKWKVHYKAWGPNSNTAASYLGFSAGFTPTPPPSTPGWATFLLLDPFFVTNPI